MSADKIGSRIALVLTAVIIATFMCFYFNVAVLPPIMYTRAIDVITGVSESLTLVIAEVRATLKAIEANQQLYTAFASYYHCLVKYLST